MKVQLAHSLCLVVWWLWLDSKTLLLGNLLFKKVQVPNAKHKVC